MPWLAAAAGAAGAGAAGAGAAGAAGAAWAGAGAAAAGGAALGSAGAGAAGGLAGLMQGMGGAMKKGMKRSAPPEIIDSGAGMGGAVLPKAQAPQVPSFTQADHKAIMNILGGLKGNG